jgi:molybdopterin-synthase adenylyltransferase
MSPEDADLRFVRQRLLPGFGEAEAGPLRLRSARVHVVGAGPAAAPALLYLARAGLDALYVDDGGDVGQADAGAWLYPPGAAGQPRMLAALEALRGVSAGLVIRPAASDSTPTAVLACPQGDGVARTAAVRARQAGLPHVVALGDASGGEVLSFPPGAPCYDCASRPGARLQPRGGAAAAVGTLAALELLLILAGVAPVATSGRRIRLVDGLPRAEATVRRPGCGCRLG